MIDKWIPAGTALALALAAVAVGVVAASPVVSDSGGASLPSEAPGSVEAGTSHSGVGAPTSVESKVVVGVDPGGNCSEVVDRIARAENLSPVYACTTTETSVGLRRVTLARIQSGIGGEFPVIEWSTYHAVVYENGSYRRVDRERYRSLLPPGYVELAVRAVRARTRYAPRGPGDEGARGDEWDANDVVWGYTPVEAAAEIPNRLAGDATTGTPPRRYADAISPPRVVARDGRDAVVRLYTWSEAEGLVVRWNVTVGPGKTTVAPPGRRRGRRLPTPRVRRVQSVERTVLARGVGAYRDYPDDLIDPTERPDERERTTGFDRTPVGNSCNSSAAREVVDDRRSVAACEAVDVSVDGRRVLLVRFRTGPHDCPSGCFYMTRRVAVYPNGTTERIGRERYARLTEPNATEAALREFRTVDSVVDRPDGRIRVNYRPIRSVADVPNASLEAYWPDLGRPPATVADRVSPPRVVANTSDGTVVELYTWSGADGVVLHWRVTVAEGDRVGTREVVATEATVVAREVGAFVDYPAPAVSHRTVDLWNR